MEFEYDVADGVEPISAIQSQRLSRPKRRQALSFAGGDIEVTKPYYPEAAVTCLRRSRYDAAAKPSLELMSGSFIWGDELQDYLEFVAHCRGKGCLRYWEPIAFRTSVIRGTPAERWRRGWEELRQVCPTWPGFREERYCESLRVELERQEAEEA